MGWQWGIFWSKNNFADLAMSKAGRYLHEMQHCGRLGADASSRIRLALAILVFHLRVGLHLTPPPNEAAHSYQLALWNNPITVRLCVASGDFFILPKVFLDECYRIPPEYSLPSARPF